jgi:hypothetical protein
MYKVMIWVQDGLITIPTTLIIRSHNVGFANLERHTYKRDDIESLNLRRIRYYTLYNEPVWPSRKTTVRVIHKLTVEEGRKKRIYLIKLNDHEWMQKEET